MRTIHQFGDSYGATLYGENDRYEIKNFIELCANQMDCSYNNFSLPGASNEMILNIIIKSINKLKSGDIVFINFSFFTRGCWYDDNIKKIKSTNELYDDINGVKKYNNKKIDKIINLVEYYLNQTKDYNFRIFNLINSILEYINSMGIDIYYTFVDAAEWSVDLIKVGTNIKFQYGFAKWLILNNMHFEQEGHYTKGIQSFLTNMILNKTNYFKIKNESITIDIDDVNFDTKLKKSIKQKLL